MNQTRHSEGNSNSNFTITMEPSENTIQTEQQQQEEERNTVALNKTNSARRVSFADNEITSVHVFRRDDDDSKPSEPSSVGFFRDVASDSGDDEQTQLEDAGKSFLRPIASAADDDDDFPVSACFIRPERLSDSGAASDDVTMDSTAFSLHYRSLARSDSGDIRIRQFGVATPSSRGSFMEFTEAKMPCGEATLDVESAGRNSNDMSIEGEHKRSYQFDRVSHPFEASLAEGAPNEIKEFTKEGTVGVCRKLAFEKANKGTPLKVGEDRGQVSDSDHKFDRVNRNPIHGIAPLSLSGRKQLLMSSPDSFRHTGNITPPLEQSGLFGPEDRVTHGATPSSVYRSISKMKTLHTTPTMSSLNEGMDRLKARLSKHCPGFSLSNKKDCERKQVESRQTQSYNEETVDTQRDKENLNLMSPHVSYNDENSKAVEMSASPSQMTYLTKVVDVGLADSTVEKGKDEILFPGSSPIQVTSQLRSLQDPPSMQDLSELSPKGTIDGHGHHSSHQSVLHVAQSPLTKSCIEISSGKKRKGVEILSNGDNIDKIGRIDGSSEVHKVENGDLQLILEQTDSMRSEREKLVDQTWNDGDLILKQFIARTNQLLPPSVDKLNLRSIGRLEDILVHLQKVKKSVILCSEIQSQHKITDPLNILRDKRTLLYNIAYEKAKLQLLHVKRDKLLKKVQQLSSGLQECEMMKLNFVSSSYKIGAVDNQADDSHFRTTLFSSQGKCQVSCKKVFEKKQELETLDSKAKSLSEFLYRYCKMEGDQNYTNITKAVSGYLQKRMTCKSILQNLKLWEIENFERKDGCYRVCLNYCGYITQRFTVNTGQSSIIISNNLNGVNIGKTFPNLDAFSAFVFVLNPHTTKKCIGSSSMARETQITSSLLSNLIDVVEEVQSASIEIRNLVEAKFCSHSVQRLDLQLSFIDFYSGKNVKVTFDITCLKCGVYPGEVLPSQIYDPSGGKQKSLPSSLVEEIRTASESERVGYSRIIRLSRCISQAVQACR